MERVKQSFNNNKLSIANLSIRLSLVTHFLQIQFYNHSGKVKIID